MNGHITIGIKETLTGIFKRKKEDINLEKEHEGDIRE